MGAFEPGESAILYVDDDPKSVKYFQLAFGRSLAVITASSVAEAEQILYRAHGQIGVLMAAQRMPVATGVQLLNRVKKRFPTIVRLLTTDHADLADAVAAVNQGEIFRYILKPWNIVQLKSELEAMLQLHRQKLAQQELLEARRQTIGALAANVAHELATPIATIASAASGFEKHLPVLIRVYRKQLETSATRDRIPAPTLEALEAAPAAIRESANRARTLTSLLLSNLSADPAQATDRRMVSMAEIIEDVLRTYPFAAGERALIDCAGTDFQVCGSPTLLTHVLYNLLRNALFAVQAAARGRIRITMEPGAGWNRLDVLDTGTGIAPDVLPRIFDEFFSIKGPGRGAGMGLPFCDRVIRDLGGEIDCHTVYGEHTRMVLRFPRARKGDCPELRATGGGHSR